VRTVTVHHLCLIRAVKFKQKGLIVTRSTHDKVRDAHKILVGKPESKRRYERQMHRWKDNIKRYLKNKT
jgi:hypothetical protein